VVIEGTVQSPRRDRRDGVGERAIQLVEDAVKEPVHEVDVEQLVLPGVVFRDPPYDGVMNRKTPSATWIFVTGGRDGVCADSERGRVKHSQSAARADLIAMADLYVAARRLVQSRTGVSTARAIADLRANCPTEATGRDPTALPPEPGAARWRRPRRHVAAVEWPP
jgi:hypothetical protein